VGKPRSAWDRFHKLCSAASSQQGERQGKLNHHQAVPQGMPAAECRAAAFLQNFVKVETGRLPGRRATKQDARKHGGRHSEQQDGQVQADVRLREEDARGNHCHDRSQQSPCEADAQ
jgi:hypothetical protein